MRQCHRYLTALLLIAPGAFATSGTKTPVPYPRKARNYGPSKARGKIKMGKTMKPAKPVKPMKPMKPYTRSGR